MIDSDIVYVFIFINFCIKDYKCFFLFSKCLCFVLFYIFKNGNYLFIILIKDFCNVKCCINKLGNYFIKSKKNIFFLIGI